MKKILGIIVLGLLLSGNAYAEELFNDLDKKTAEDGTVCEYKRVLNKTKPCDKLALLRFSLNNPYIKYLPRPSNISLQQYKDLIQERIDNHPEFIKNKKDREKYDKEQADLHCSILGGKANNWFSSRKIYKSCMKAKGY